MKYRNLVGSLIVGMIGFGNESRAEESPVGTRRALVICGLPGDDEHRGMYAAAVEKIARALVTRCGFDAANVWVRFGVDPKDDDGPAIKAGRGLSTRDNLASDAKALREASKPEDTLWVIAIGHGHLDGRRASLNLPGPDLSDAAFARLFDGIKAREQVFVVAQAASGFFLRPLAAPGRVAISATEADQDKDGAISWFELYLAIVADVTRRYVEDELIPTEHAQLDDNGDGRGSEIQRVFLPPEDAPKDEEKDKPKAPPAKPEPKLGPKDDGALASKVRVDRPAGPKP